MTAEDRLARAEKVAENLADHAGRCLAMVAEAHEREHRLIGMVEERDRLIDELRHRIRLLAMPNGAAGWEGSD